MRILDLGEFYSERGGGVRSYSNGLLEAAAARGHEVVLMAPGPKDSDERLPGGRVLRYRAPRMPYDGSYHVPYRLRTMRRWVRELQPHVLQLSSPYLPWLAARGLQTPLRSYVYHSDPIGAYVTPLAARLVPPLGVAALDVAWGWMRAVCNSCDVTVVAGEWLERDLQQRGIQRIRSVPFGIAHERFQLSASNMHGLGSTAPATVSDGERPQRVLIAGRLAIEKRQALLLRAVAKLNELRRDTPASNTAPKPTPELELTVLGDGPEGASLRRLAERFLPRTRFIPFTRDPAEYAQLLASADVLLHGSCCETFGFVLVETLASGTPIVVPDAGSAPHLAGPDACVTYSTDATEEQIAAAIAQILARPRAETRRAAQHAAQRHPSRQEHYDNLFALYEELLAQHGRRAVHRRGGAPGFGYGSPTASPSGLHSTIR